MNEMHRYDLTDAAAAARAGPIVGNPHAIAVNQACVRALLCCVLCVRVCVRAFCFWWNNNNNALLVGGSACAAAAASECG